VVLDPAEVAAVKRADPFLVLLDSLDNLHRPQIDYLDFGGLAGDGHVAAIGKGHHPRGASYVAQQSTSRCHAGPGFVVPHAQGAVQRHWWHTQFVAQLIAVLTTKQQQQQQQQQQQKGTRKTRRQAYS
jgi:hypothetical protein